MKGFVPPATWRRADLAIGTDRMKTVRPTGPAPLVIIGGAEDKTGDCRVLREFVRLAGGARGRLAVMTVATEHQSDVGAEYVRVFHKVGVKSVQPVEVTSRAEAADETVLEALEKATGVFFTGGNQMRITNLLGGTAIDQLLRRRQEEHKLVLGGTSAGAAMMSSTMIVGGASETTPRAGVVEVGPGMDFLRGAMIDQHFTRRGRAGRLLAALAQYPHQLGIGIDEDTAMVVHGTTFRVLGSGAVTVFDLGQATVNNVLELKGDAHLALCGVRLHILPDGFGFDLHNRVPLSGGGRTP
jgi:cyanophycinase